MVYGSGNFFPPSTGSFPLPVAPPDIDPDDGQQVTVCFSADWLPVVIGALQQLALQATWQGDDAAVLLAQNRAQTLIAMFGGEGGGCESAICIKGLRYDADCDCIMQTLDGGETEFPNPDADPRHGEAFRYPPVDADDQRCQAAANMVRWISDLIDQVLEIIGVAGTAEGLVAIILAATGVLGPFAILIDLVLGLAFVLFGAGGSAIAAAFTSGVYDQLLCIFDCNIQPDGSVTPADLERILAAINDDIGGLAATVLAGMFLLMGEVGLSNAGTVGSAPADCDDCDCGWCYHWDFRLTDGGWFRRDTLEGNYIPGSGWSANCITSGSVGQRVVLQYNLPGAPAIQIDTLECRLEYVQGGKVGGGPESRQLNMREFSANNGGGSVLVGAISTSPLPTGTYDGSVISTQTPHSVELNVWSSVGECSGSALFTDAYMRGTGSPPALTGGEFC